MTPRQTSFVAYKLEGLSNRAAVIAAGYSPAGAKQMGTYLMKHPAVTSALKKRGFNFTSGKRLVASFRRSAGPWLAIAETMPKRVYESPIEFLIDAMNCHELPLETRAEFAAALLPYQHKKIGFRRRE